MTKLTSIINTAFFTAVLILGTIATISPSFMIGAQADPYSNNNNYDIDREKKSDRSVSVQSLKCNNINVNVNGLELNVLPPFIGGEVAATAAEDGQTNANSFANNNNNGNSNGGSVINDFRFICINNNNNTVIQGEEPIPPTPPVDNPCEECFTSTLNQTQITAIFPISNPNLGNADNLADLCDFLAGLTTTQEKIQADIALVGLLSSIPSISSAEIQEITGCLQQLGLIIDPA